MFCMHGIMLNVMNYNTHTALVATGILPGVPVWARIISQG